MKLMGEPKPTPAVPLAFPRIRFARPFRAAILLPAAWFLGFPSTALIGAEPSNPTGNTLPLTVTSTPSGAQVQVDGRDPLGNTPANTPVTLILKEGKHEITASYPGLDSQRLTVHIGPDSPAPIHIPFRYAALRLTSEPDGAIVWKQEKLIGKTPLQLPPLPPGIHHFLLRREGCAKTTVELVLFNGENRESHTKLALNPEPEPGFSFTNAHGLRMVWISRLQGWAQATEMTQAAYEAVANQNPSEFKEPAHPVENVTWADAFRFCDQLTTAEQGRGFLPPGYQYALPTDDQWSLLAEGSSRDQGVHSLIFARKGPAKAGSQPPSPLGIQDAIGNVWEWCLDWYSPSIAERARREGSPVESDKIGSSYRVLRGGSWNRSIANQLQVSIRRAALPTEHKDYETGFRVVLIPRPR